LIKCGIRIGQQGLGVDTVSGIPKGLWTFVTSTEETVTKDRSRYEDTYVQALFTVSKYKRRGTPQK